MRLHRLEVQAFGPFADAVSVDLDQLSEAGLFLLSGATGAGKTSVLDAVCFALYGDVPGDRSAAKRLRCDQAASGVAPRVELEATLGGRRFRLTRSPAWERPKKRGTGTTTEQARATVSELVDGTWVPLSSRLDEAGDLVARVTGLSLTQFTQVAMLPQGRFQAFLRAKSDERHALLQRLFRTGRFEAVERWLADHRRSLARADARHHERVADVVSRAAETAAVSLPTDLDLHDLAPAADDGTLRTWLDSARTAAADAAAVSRRRAASAAGDEVERRLALESARADVERRGRLVEARAELDALRARTLEHDADLARLDAARRAAAVVPWRRQVDAGGARADEAAATAATALARVTACLDDLEPAPGPEQLLARADAALADAAAVAALRPRARRLDELGDRVHAARRHRDRLHDELERVQHERAVRPARVAELHVELLTVQETATTVDSLTAAAQEARGRLDARRRADELEPSLLEARHELLRAREVTVQAKDELLTLQLARIDGMAAELAGALAVGGCCPVCGSADHPAKARPAPGAPDADAERRSRGAVDDAAVVEHARDQRVRELEQTLAGAVARAGTGSADEIAAHLASLQDHLAAALHATGRLPDLQARLDADRRALDDLAARAETLLAEVARAESERAALAAEADHLTAELAAALHESAGDLEAVHDHHRRVADTCRTAAAALCEAHDAEAQRDDAVAAAAAAALEAGFDDVDDAVAAALGPAALARLGDSTARHQRRVAALDEVVRTLGPASDAPLPDLDTLDADHSEALARLRLASADAALHHGRADRLAGLLGELDDALAAWAPDRADLDVAACLSAFVEGRSADNLLRMRLSAYVLAYRLGQVVDSANERLASMSDQRYSLEHTGRRGAGETRGGLSLQVRDDWSGESRDPVTLSGGETFVVSLALALGLADVISHEAGGATLDTLFVDEGFGSLDADTLDDVMDTLDALRDGGRVVGVVSHVAEMRDRIPTQLVVTKSRRGSTLALRA